MVLIGFGRAGLHEILEHVDRPLGIWVAGNTKTLTQSWHLGAYSKMRAIYKQYLINNVIMNGNKINEDKK